MNIHHSNMPKKLSLDLSALRIIIENQAGELLMQRFESTPEDMLASQRGTRVLPFESHWGFSQLEGTLFSGESFKQALWRIVNRRFGIEIDYVTLAHTIKHEVDDGTQLKDVYYYTRLWGGSLHRSCDPNRISELKQDRQGIYMWINPAYLSTFAVLPETHAVIQSVHQRVGLKI